MTKTEKRLIVLELLKQFIQSKKPLENEDVLEKVICEIYSCGYESVSRLKLVSNGISVFLESIINQTLKFGSTDWENADSIIGLLELISLSVLPDK